MEIFIDSADIKEIEKWLKMGIVDGIITIPPQFLNRVADHKYTRATVA